MLTRRGTNATVARVQWLHYRGRLTIVLCFYLTFLFCLLSSEPFFSNRFVQVNGNHRQDFETSEQNELIGSRRGISLAPSGTRFKRFINEPFESEFRREGPGSSRRPIVSSKTTARSQVDEPLLFGRHLNGSIYEINQANKNNYNNNNENDWPSRQRPGDRVSAMRKAIEAIGGQYETRDVAYFLEGHPAMVTHDPRAYFTDERTSRALAILLHELPQIPEKLRFAFVVRTFHELGRKIASKLNMYHEDIYKLLKKQTDELGTKPEVSTYLDIISRAFESKQDRQPSDRRISLTGSFPNLAGENSPSSETKGREGEGARRRRRRRRRGKTTTREPDDEAQGLSKWAGRRRRTRERKNKENKKQLDLLFDLLLGGFLQSKLMNQGGQKQQQQKQQIWPNNRTKFVNNRGPIQQLLDADPSKAAVWNASLNEIAKRFAHTMSFFVVNATRANLLPKRSRRQATNKVNNLKFKTTPTATVASVEVARLLGDALRHGAREMLLEMSDSDKHAAPVEALEILRTILRKTLVVLERHASAMDDNADETTLGQFMAPQTSSFNDLNPISGVNGLLGPWNTYLFDHLGTSERTIKLFASLLRRVSLENKSRFINLYAPVVRLEFLRTMSGFIALQTSPQQINRNSSEEFLLDSNKSVSISPGRSLKLRSTYAQDKNRLPARCYLAGRRWRLYLRKALKGYTQADDVIQGFLDQINDLKTKVTAYGSSDQLERLCLPRLGMGLKGWGINGDPPSEANAATSKFQLRNPIEGLNTDEDPFTSGARMGYRLGFMIGYNEKRNASLEMEHGAPKKRQQQQRPFETNSLNPRFFSRIISRRKQASSDALFGLWNQGLAAGQALALLHAGNNETSASEAARKTRMGAVENSAFLAKAAYWHGTMVGARRALDIGCREGYMATLKVSLRAGMLLPLEAGSRLASIKAANFASQAAGEAGRQFVNKYLMDRDALDEQTRRQLVELGGTYGSLAGATIGENLGAIVGREAALEAYRRSVSRGGKVARAKFHLDEFAAGAKVGFEHGVGEGGRVALSSSLDPTAPALFTFTKPEFSSMVSQAFGEVDEISRKIDTSTSSSKSKPSSDNNNNNNNNNKNNNNQRKPNNDTATSKSAGVALGGGDSRGALIGESSPSTSTSSASPMDHWEKDLITPLTPRDIEQFHATRNHTRVLGSLRGQYSVSREVKKGLEAVSYSNQTYQLNIQAIGFMMNDIAYLSLSGKIDNANVLHGSIIARDLIS